MVSRRQNSRDIFVPASLGSKVLSELTENELFDLFRQLTEFVRRRCKNHREIDPRDVVQKAFVRVRSGRRRHWNTLYTPFENMCFVVKDILYHERDHQMDQLEENWEQNVSSSLISNKVTPLDILLANCELKEQSERYRSREMLINSAIADDPLLQRLWSAVKNIDRWDTKQLAAELGVDETKVYQATRKLKRRVISRRTN